MLLKLLGESQSESFRSELCSESLSSDSEIVPDESICSSFSSFKILSTKKAVDIFNSRNYRLSQMTLIASHNFNQKSFSALLDSPWHPGQWLVKDWIHLWVSSVASNTETEPLYITESSSSLHISTLRKPIPIVMNPFFSTAMLIPTQFCSGRRIV